MWVAMLNSFVYPRVVSDGLANVWDGVVMSISAEVWSIDRLADTAIDDELTDVMLGVADDMLSGVEITLLSTAVINV